MSSQDTAKELFRQALREKQPRIIRGVYIATPNLIGEAMERFKTLCQAEGIDPKTGEREIQ